MQEHSIHAVNGQLSTWGLKLEGYLSATDFPNTAKVSAAH